MPIHRLVTEVTGLDMTADDGLPQKICVLCISYLKHAYTFRRQTIDNVAALLAAKYLLGAQEERKESKNGEEIIPTMVAPAVIRANVNDAGCKMTTSGGRRRRKSVPYQKNLDKEVLQQVLGVSVQQLKKQNNAEEEQRHIDEAFLDRWQDSSPEDKATGSASAFFSYTEKEFQEDDVMELDVLKEYNITFNLPEDYKEKKCPSCRKRFMFDESYNEHLKECLLFKLVKFIREVYHFLFLKENRSISSFEFIRRVIFSVKKTNELISCYDDESTEPELEVATTSSAPTVDDDESKIERSFLTNLEKLRVSYNPEGTIIPSPVALIQQSDDCRSSFTTESASISPLVTMTRCEQCHMTFESVTELEAHNLNNHRQPAHNTDTTPNNLKRLAPFPRPPVPPSPKNVDIIKNTLLSRTPDLVTRDLAGSDSDDQRKMVTCKRCQRRFYTISQLDNHQIRSCSQKSPQRLLESRDSPADRSRKNLNASYFYTMELLKEMK